MPKIQKMFEYTKTVANSTTQNSSNGGGTVNLYNDISLPNTATAVSVSRLVNQRFGYDLIETIRETNLLEETETRNDSKAGNLKYGAFEQYFTIFGCRFTLYVDINFKLYLHKSYCYTGNLVYTGSNLIYTEPNSNYYDKLPLTNGPIKYYITIYYNDNFICVYMKVDGYNEVPIFTIIKCKSIDNQYNFVYVSRDVNTSRYIHKSVGLNGTTGGNANPFRTSPYYHIQQYAPRDNTDNNVTIYSHFICYEDKAKNDQMIMSNVEESSSRSYNIFKQYIQTGPIAGFGCYLFESYATRRDFNTVYQINNDNILFTKPVCANGNIIFGDNIFWVPHEIFKPGNLYDIDGEKYWCPGNPGLENYIQAAGESNYKICCNRWLFKI